ncbi:MAG: tetratricopeptide repeat protein, partial [Nannocystaceae bacterium]|nr:tetratricopeptide repeat protein [Nannocystaceae bacterium]
ERLDEAEAVTDDALPVSISIGIATERSNLALRVGKTDLAAAYVSHAQSLARLDVAGMTQQGRLELDLVQEQINLATGNTSTSVEALLRITDALPKRSEHGLFARSLLADAYVDRLQLDEADRTYARALEHPLANGPEARAPLQINRASALARAGRADAARASLDAFEATYPGGAPVYFQGPALATRAAVLRLQGRHTEARERAHEALQLFLSLSPSHPSVPSVLDELSRIELGQEQWRPAFDRAQAALEGWEGLGLANAPQAAGTLVLMSQALLELGHQDKAAGAAEAAVEIFKAHGRPAAEIAIAHLAVAAAQGEPNPSAQAVCDASELAQCRGGRP